MVYAGDQWILLPVRDIYDTLMMAMAINAAKDMYEKGQQEMKDFLKAYGDFLTPIAADQDWYNQNVTGKVRDLVNALYAQGVDPLRNPQARAMISLAINNMPYGQMAQMRLSAANALEFLKAKLKLQAEGKWNAALDPYDGPSLEGYSTLDSGVWNRMSPTPYENMADFSKAYFDNIKPFKTSASKNGISYTKSEISMDDLRRIAKQHHNDLVNTPQGLMMYKYYKELYGSDEKAREAFDEAVVSGNTDRLYYEDDYNDNWLKKEGLRLQQEDNDLARDKFNWEKYKWQEELKQKKEESKNPDNGDKGRNYYQDLFDRGLNFFTYGREGMPAQTAALDAENGRNVLKVAQVSMKPLNEVVDNDDKWNERRDSYLAQKISKNTLSQKVLVDSSGREVDKSRSHTVFATVGDIDRMYSDDNIVSTTFGGIRNSKTRQRRMQNNSELAKYKDPNKKMDKLKMQFTNETYTAPIVGNDGKVRMTQFLKVNLYDHDVNKYIGTKWYKVLESEPTGAFVEEHSKKNGRDVVTRKYRSVPTTQSSSLAGEMQYNATEAEHVLRSTAEGKYNSLTRY